MTVRPAMIEDIPALVEMGAKFHAMSPHKFLGGYEPEAMRNMLGFMISSNSGLVLTNGVGAIGGMLAPVYFAPGRLMMDEAFWFAGGEGMDLLAAFERESRAMGAHFVLMSTLENERSPVMDRVMRRKGYKPVERRHIKELI